ncbi:MAG: radical SAM protein [Myxococcota bacterium]
MPLPLELIEESPAARVRELKGIGDEHLLVHEVYAALQGEGTHVGLPCVFVRTTGCHLRCRYCDTAHAFHEGRLQEVDEVVSAVRDYQIPLVLLTGGEPLLQSAAIPLLTRLCDAGLTVLLETSGGVSTARVDPRVRIILDVKTPGSGEYARNVWDNLERLRPHDELKFVLCSDDDYVFARDFVRTHQLYERCAVLFSPEASVVDKGRIAQRIVDDRLPVRMQVQLHKVLFGDRRGV